MVQLQILSGRRAGEMFDCRVPVSIGRAEQSSVLLADPGIFPHHAKIRWTHEGMVFEVEPDALASINGTPTAAVILRNGDLITLGGVNVRFGLSPVRQSGARLREWLTWIGLGALCAGQIWEIYWLSQ